MKTKMMIAAVAAVTLVSGAALAAGKGKGDNVMTKQKDGTYVVNTTTLASNVRGYVGSTPLEVYIKKNKVVKVVALPNKETPKIFAKVKSGMLPSMPARKPLPSALSTA